MPVNYKRDYHPKWRLISYLVIVVRANNHCERCGAKRGDPHPITRSRVILSCAHLNRDRRINRFWNLAALCQRCHLKHDMSQHNYARRYGRQTPYVNGKLFEVPPDLVPLDNKKAPVNTGAVFSTLNP